jgi:hypothetical protein
MAKRVLKLPLNGCAFDLAQKAVKSNFMLLLALGTNKPSRLSIVTAYNSIDVFYGLATVALEFSGCQTSAGLL